MGLSVDWLLANLTVLVVIQTPQVWQAPVTGIDFLPLIVFGLEVWLLTAFLGASVGHRVSGLAVIGPDGRLPGVGRAAARTVLILLVVPPLVVDPDGRGLHDRLAGTLLVRAR